MKKFTINDIRSWQPYYDPNRYLPESWHGTVLDILNNKHIPFIDRLWIIMRTDLVSERLMRRFAVWCARRVQHLIVDERKKRSSSSSSLHALDVAEAYAENRWLIDDPDYAAAWEDERDTALAAARAAAKAREAGALGISVAAAQAAARFTAGRAPEDAAKNAAWAAAWAAAKAKEARAMKVEWSTTEEKEEEEQIAQEQKLREMLIEGIETGDIK